MAHSVELITGQRRRRRWTAEEKARIVAESFEEGANISEVARRHGVVRGLGDRRFSKASARGAIQRGRNPTSVGATFTPTPG